MTIRTPLATAGAVATLLASTHVDAQSVRTDHGNVVYVAKDGTARTLTHAGRDSSAVLSPDGRTVAFVRYVGGTIETPYPDLPRTELRTVGVATGNERLLVRSAAADSPERTLADFRDPAFSPDGATLYFVSQAWVTSGAVHAVTLATGRERYVCPGSALEVVPRGRYSGDLLVEQHRYFLGGGSYDWTWLLTPAGHDVGPVGESNEQVDEFKRQNVDGYDARQAPPRPSPSAPAPVSPGRR